MARMTVADLAVGILAEAGVERIYGMVGDSLNGLVDSLRRHGGIRWIPVRHEEVAAFAAGADAAVTGQLTVCAGSAGPGNLHLINGLFDCHRSRVPVLAIAAHIPSAEIGSGYFQETHPQELFKECSHYCELVSSPEQMPQVLEIAMRTALLEGGVSVVVLPGDIALRPARDGVMPNWSDIAPPAVVASMAEVDRLAELLDRAERITLLCGAGCAGAHDEVVALADELKAPIVHAMRGKEHLEWDNPFDVGMTGLIGFASGYHAMTECDLLLMLGTDFPYRNFYPADARIAQIDRRPGNLGRRCRMDLGVVADVKSTIPTLLDRLGPRGDRTFLDAALQHYTDARTGLDELAVGRPGRKPIHPQYLAAELSDVAAEDAIFTCDVGTPTIWAARYLKMNGKRRLLGSFNHGSMANALAQAIGAQTACPGGQVISMSGDGGVAMLMGDLLTLKQLELPVKIVVFNNSSLGFVALEMKAAGYLDTGTDLKNPDFAAVAMTIGILGIHVENPGGVRPALEKALAHDGPVLVDVVTNKQEVAVPPKLELEQVKGFSLYALKAVLNGRGDEVIELARTNILR